MPFRTVSLNSPRELTEFVNGAQKATVAAIVGGGTGYSTNDILDVVGGNGVTAQLSVTTQVGGVITVIAVETEGAYTTAPSNPVSVVGGDGNDDATFNLTLADAVALPADVEGVTHRDGQWYVGYWT